MSATAPASRVRKLAPTAAWLLAAGLAIVSPTGSALAADWPEISDEERKLASVDPAGPGAILLFEEAEVDDRAPQGRLQSLYRRFKILLPSGVPWATFVVSLDEPLVMLTALGRQAAQPGQGGGR